MATVVCQYGWSNIESFLKTDICKQKSVKGHEGIYVHECICGERDIEDSAKTNAPTSECVTVHSLENNECYITVILSHRQLSAPSPCNN